LPVPTPGPHAGARLAGARGLALTPPAASAASKAATSRGEVASPTGLELVSPP
jgi:hypothetical protein